MILLVLVVGRPVTAGDRASMGGERQLSIVSDGSELSVPEAVASRLETSLMEFLESCRELARVVGEQPSQADLRSLWEGHEEGSRALLRATAAHDSRHVALRGTEFSALFGFEPVQGPWPVLTRSEDGTLTAYTKCDGLTGLLLSCDVDDLAPARKPSADCAGLRQLQRDRRDSVVSERTPATEPE